MAHPQRVEKGKYVCVIFESKFYSVSGVIIPFSPLLHAFLNFCFHFTKPSFSIIKTNSIEHFKSIYQHIMLHCATQTNHLINFKWIYPLNPSVKHKEGIQQHRALLVVKHN